MSARGPDAQAKKARRKAEKREARGRETEPQAEQRRIDEAVNALVAEFRGAVTDTVSLAVGERLRRIKADRDMLRETAQAAKKLADDRRNELDGQVSRARDAEAGARSLREQLEQAGRKAEAKHCKEVEKHKGELARRDEIIEEQASTIKAQAVALREANKRNKGS